MSISSSKLDGKMGSDSRSVGLFMKYCSESSVGSSGARLRRF